MQTGKVDSVCFSTKGQIVLPARLRRQFDIKAGTRASVTATPEGILLKPITPATIRRGRGILKRIKEEKSWTQEWAEQQAQEKELEDRHAR
jgi:AbrB family looped-hinge helix DNA binding protein